LVILQTDSFCDGSHRPFGGVVVQLQAPALSCLCFRQSIKRGSTRSFRASVNG
jgi:hypothetical protein